MNLNHPLPPTITEILTQLRQLSQIDVQSGWLIIQEKETERVKVKLNDKGYIVWEAGGKVQWLEQNFLIPEALNGYPVKGLILRLALTWWASDAKIFVNDQLVQAGDLFDSSARILLTDFTKPGEVIKVTLKLTSPSHDIGALMASRCLYESPDEETLEPGFIADEIEILAKYLSVFAPSCFPTCEQIITALTTANFPQVRQALTALTSLFSKYRIKLLGHSHLDLAWLWELPETYAAAQRTFSSVINLQKDFPELTFCHTSPTLYQWIEEHNPQLFTAIQAAVREGKWEVLGGMWVEPEVNLVSGESLVRQLLYGQRYFQAKFGEVTRICWLTDSFGFNWQLPQILHQAGIEYFVTQKLHWNDTTEFPYGAFWWESPDGTRIFTLMSPPNVAGVMDTNPIAITNYAIAWEQQTGLQDIFWLPGVGDHGGGPSRDMLEVMQRWQRSPFFPTLEFTTARAYLDSISQQLATKEAIPVWCDELYLEFHRGCYTTHADQKRYNRHSEGLLYQAELWASLATLISQSPYPQKEMETAWKKVLFNQFHDILPGTSIPQVFVTANQDWEEVIRVGEKILQESLTAIAASLSLPSPPHPDTKPILIFNSLNWGRSSVISLPKTWGEGEIFDFTGEKLLSQTTEDGLLFYAPHLPPIGYHLFWLKPGEKAPIPPDKGGEDNWILENEYLRVTVHPETGDLSSIWDKIQQREVLGGAGNQLQAFQDQGQYWDAWNIDPHYQQYPFAPTVLKSKQWLEKGPVRSRLQVIRQLNQSTFTQDYILDTRSRQLTIKTIADWQESHTLLKVAFPLNLTTDFASYEIPCGTITRTTQPQTPQEHAKWEVPALRWADLSDNEYGVSLLNNCKYGYDCQPNQIRLTLLRSPHWPDPNCDRGMHHFTYSLYPHQGSWQTAKTVHQGSELNLPPLVVPWNNSTMEKLGPGEASFLDLGSDNLILMAFKPSEDHPQNYILRCYEGYGQETELTLQSPLHLNLTHPVDLLENPLPKNEDLLIKPWQIKSFMIESYPF